MARIASGSESSAPEPQRKFETAIQWSLVFTTDWETDTKILLKLKVRWVKQKYSLALAYTIGQKNHSLLNRAQASFKDEREHGAVPHSLPG